MPDLAGRGPLGQKASKTELTARVYYGEILDPIDETEKPAPKPRKPVRKVSAKRAAYMRSPERKAALIHMARVKLLPCICCGRPAPSDAHHVNGDGMPRDDMRTIPLCWACHRGPHGYHNDKANWVAKYGPDYAMLDQVAVMLNTAPPDHFA